MVTRITNDNNEFYEQLFNEVSQQLENFVKKYIKTAKASDGTTLIQVLDESETTVLETPETELGIIDTIDFQDGISTIYTHYIMGEPNDIDLSADNDTTAIKLCQAYLDVGNGNVRGLAEYFGIIETITNCIDTNYRILPLVAKDGEWIHGEEPFYINANTRSIKVPNNDYVYAVSGDDIAETIYFVIDRYFDNEDLSTKNIAVLSQIGNKKILTEIYLKDITSMADMIIFGWPIGKEITKKTSGTLEFSVRFYTLDGDDISYSLSTIPQRLTIKNGLDFLTDEGVIKDNSSYRAKESLANADISGSGIAAIRTPIFHLGEENNNIYDLDTNGQVILSAAAHSLDTLPINYYWTKEDDKNTFKEITGSNNTSGSEYIEINPTKDDLKKYATFYMGDSKTPVILKEEDLNNLSTEIKYYRDGSQYEANIAGKYQCVAKVTRGIRNKIARSDIFEVPGPASFSMQKKSNINNLTFIFTDEESEDLTLAAKSFDNVIDNIFENNVDITKQSITSTLTAVESDIYKLSRINTRNKVETQPVFFADQITIYQPIPKPTYTYTLGEITEKGKRPITISLTNYNAKYMDYSITMVTAQNTVSPLENGKINETLDADRKYTLMITYIPRYNLISGGQASSNTEITENFEL